MSFSIYLVGFFTYNEPRIFNGEGFFPELSPKPQTAHDAPLDTFEEIRGHIAQGKWFTEPELRLAHVAERTGWSMHDVSRAVNACAGKNFNQWINEFRIEYAKELLVHDDALSIKEICHACGFNSKSAFFNAFRSVTGQTPLEFKSRQHA
jgi:AraC-like DNA-binding protein